MITPAPGPSVVAVVGGGVTGLAAARRLSQAGVRVVLLEADDVLGGQIRTIELAGRPVDVGAEALHLAAPSARAAVDELGLGSTVVGARSGTSWLWTARGRRVLPAGIGPAGPTRLGPVLRSRVMTLGGLARAGLEPLMARLRRPLDLAANEDVSVGAFVTSRFGRQVADRFVDPLLGSLHAGDVHQLSLRACAPYLVPAAAGRSSLVIRRNPKPATAGPGRPGGASEAGQGGKAGQAAQTSAPVMFASWSDGLSTLTEAMLRDVAIDVRTGAPVTALTRNAGRYELEVADGSTVRADAVVLAIPSAAAARLLSPLAPDAGAILARQQTARIATVVLGYRRAEVADVPALAGNGLLIPSGTGTLLKAVTHLSTKWPHLDDDDTYLVRLSAGRAGADELDQLDDASLVTRLRADLKHFIGIDAEPTVVHVQRWPAGLPQLHVGHLERMHAARAELAEHLPGVVLAGASYEGVGITSCLSSAESAATTVLSALTATEPA